MSKWIDCQIRASSTPHPRCCHHSSSAAAAQPVCTAGLGRPLQAPKQRSHSFSQRGRLGKGLRTCAALAFDGDSNEMMSRDATMEEYLQLKQFLLRRTQRAAGFVSLYILLVVSGEAALCAALGGVGSYVYTAWLCADVDRVSPNDEVPMVRANNIRDAWPRRFARVVAGLRQQLQPRLLVPIALGAAVWTYNTQSGDELTLAEQGSLLVGFFSFKIAHILLLYEELRPKFGSETPTRRVPRMDGVEDISFDIYARETKKLQAIEDADEVLAQEEEKKRKRLG